MSPVSSEQFQLLRLYIVRDQLAAVKQLHLAELLIGYRKNSDITVFGQPFLYAFDMNIGIFPTRTMSQINRELKHSEPVA